MPQSISNIILHLIFSTKNRRPCLTTDLAVELEPFMGGVLNGLGCQSLAVGTADDHAHNALALSRVIAPHVVVRELKRASCMWLRARAGELKSFEWQRGYALFSGSAWDKQELLDYVRKQRTHHQDRTFQVELRDILHATQTPFDEKWVWD